LTADAGQILVKGWSNKGVRDEIRTTEVARPHPRLTADAGQILVKRWSNKGVRDEIRTKEVARPHGSLARPLARVKV
jgi:hypothetical protein